MFDSITVRKITKNDKSKYFEMSRRFYEAGVTNSKITDEGREKFFKEILSGEIVRGYFMCFNGQVAGYAVCALSASQEACGYYGLTSFTWTPNTAAKALARSFLNFSKRERITTT